MCTVVRASIISKTFVAKFVIFRLQRYLYITICKLDLYSYVSYVCCMGYKQEIKTKVPDLNYVTNLFDMNGIPISIGISAQQTGKYYISLLSYWRFIQIVLH